MLLEFIAANQSSQLITEPTTSTDTASNLLDILITSNPNLFLYTGVIHSSVSDHFPIYGVLSTNKIEKKSVHRIITTWRIDMDINHNFIEEIDRIPSSVIEIFDNPNDQLFVWQMLFTSILDEYYPVCQKRIRKKSHPWITHDILVLMRKRDHARKKSFKTKLKTDVRMYKRLRNKVIA